jgi:sugar lactone lactonase YvrE
MASTTASGASSSLLALLLAGCSTATPGVTGIGFSLPIFTQATPTPAAVTSTPMPTATVVPVVAAVPTSAPTPAPAGGGGSSGGGPAATPEPQEVVTLAGAREAGYADGAGAQARFNFPQALALAPDGALFVADRLNHRIRKVLPDGTTSTVAGTGAAGFAEGAMAKFDEPSGLALAADGTLFVADAWNHRIRAVAPDGTVSTLAGSGVPGDADGQGNAAAFDHPGALAVGADGALYVADEYAQTIRRVAMDGTVTTVAGDGYSKGHLDGPGTDARLTFPVGLAAAADGSLYVAERDACYLRKVDAAGAVSTLNPLTNYRCGFGDGALANAFINNALGLAIAPDGGLLIADTLDGKLRKVDLAAGQASTLAGSDPGFHDGARARARFLGPVAVAAAADGTLYVADGHAIRKLLKPAG